MKKVRKVPEQVIHQMLEHGEWHDKVFVLTIASVEYHFSLIPCSDVY